MNKKTAKQILEKVVEDYSAISEDFNRTRQHQWSEFDTFLPFIEEGEKIVDLGCGNGRFYDYIKEKKGSNYIGIDNNQKLLEHAKRKHPNAKFIQGNLLKVPLETEDTDLVISIAALHHIPSHRLKLKALQEMHRILKPNGTAIITVWNLFQKKYKKYVWYSRLKHILSLGRYDSRDTFIPWGKSGTKRYYYAFKPQELEKMAKKAGFEITKQEIGNNIVLICKKS